MIRKVFLIFLFVTVGLHCYSQDRLPKNNLGRVADTIKVKASARKTNLDVNSITLLKKEFPLLKGNSITIAQKENLADITHIDLLNRISISATASSLVTDHATRMATLMVGAGFYNPLNQGVATDSKLVSTDFSKLFPEDPSFYASNSISIVNHSYGSGVENFYGQEAMAYDAFSQKMPNVLNVFSSGNLGYSLDLIGKYKNIPGWANLTGNYKTAKNVLTVGAIDEYYQLLPSSSRGPAFDGRIKPELVAYSDEGASAAAAIVSGTAALMQEAFKKQSNKNAPSALIKAVLINSADDVGRKGIDFETGFGNVNAFRAVSTIADKRFIELAVANGDVVELRLNVPISSKNLKITLVWLDQESVLISSKSLVNDLDLEVYNDKETFKPWVLSSFPNVDSLSKLPSRMEDHLNNVEQVSIEGHLSSTYKISVKGTNVVGSVQPFFIAYQWDVIDSFQWISPVKECNIPAGEPFILRWKKLEEIKSGKIEISLNNQTWQPVLENVNLNLGYAEIQMPNTFNMARIRLIANEKAYVSDNFNISPKVNTSSTFYCKDSIGLQWDSANDADIELYKVYKFNRKTSQWDSLNITNKKKLVIGNSENTSYYAVAPISKNKQEGFRSIAISAKEEEVNCFYKRLTINMINELPELTLEFSSTENISNVTFQKLKKNTIVNLGSQTINALSTNYYTSFDSLPDEGMNTYRAQLNLLNGQQVYTDYTSINVFKTKRFNLFPVPVASGQEIEILADKFGDYQIVLLDLQGKIIGEHKFTGSAFKFPTSGFNKGIFIYYIMENLKKVQSGKFIVQ